jgi:5-oxoprolinase (ATP-hydrolysing)
MNTPKTFYYFAYGSNLKLSEIRRTCTSAERKLRVKLPDYTLVFPRKSEGRQCGVASIQASAGGEVWGGVYEISELEKRRLESREGYNPVRALAANSYVLTNVTVFADGDLAKPVEVMTFIANKQSNPPLPSEEYKRLIIDGAREWNLDSIYTANLELIVTNKP